MATSPDAPDGAALLVASYGSDPAAAPLLGRIGETLLATMEPWSIVAPSGDLERQLGELAARPARVAILAISGLVTPAGLATGPDAAVPLAWLRDRLREARAERLLLALSARGDGGADRWLAALGTRRASQLIAVHAAPAGWPLLDALLAGLAGAAVDARTGTLTLDSIGDYLAQRLSGLALQPSRDLDTFTTLPPVAAASGDGDDLIGTLLPGRLRVERRLASGSFGVVYRARQLAVDRDVAVKVLMAGIDPASEDGRLFVEEIRSVGRIDHPNVVRIHQADVTPGGRLFFAMELLVGRDLQEIVRDEAPLDDERAVELARQLLAGLGAVHDAGLVHSDVKPGNAFVTVGRSGERVVLLDFGLARLKPPGGAADSMGGTPAYMAPEQLHQQRVDVRSDLFSAALVLVTLLTGWRRQSARDEPPLERIADPRLRAVLARALAADPAQRFQTAADLADALARRDPAERRRPGARPPFRHLAPLTERDGDGFRGREREVAALLEQVLGRRAVIYTAPSGVGKTSLLRAGLAARVGELGGRAVYAACRPGTTPALAQAIWPGSRSLAEAVGAWHRQRGTKLVLVIDQLEAALSESDRPAILDEILAMERWPAEAEVAVVLGIREDFLARLVSLQGIPDGIAVVRLGPMGVEGAREAIVAPLAAFGLSMEPALLDVLLGELVAAAAAIGAQMGWGRGDAVYPPHLQLACSVLHEALAPGETVITLAHHRRLGGLDAIVGEYLERVLDTELDAASTAVAREILLALVAVSQTRSFQTEAQLAETLGPRCPPDKVAAVLELLRARGLLARLRASGDEWGWELIHDSLVPRVQAWIDRRDLARRRAAEIVRYHLRRSRPEAPSLLGDGELRELRAHADVIAELDAEWARRRSGEAWTPGGLVARSRRSRRRRRLAALAAATALLAAAAVPITFWLGDREARRREQTLRDRDLGRFTLELAPFDWDERELRPVAVPARGLPALSWRLLEADGDDPGAPAPDFAVVRGRPAEAPDGVRVEAVEARGGRMFLEVSGRGAAGESCPPSLLLLRQLPGYAQRGRPAPRLRVRVPTCRASRAGTVAVEAGRFVYGGAGEPAAARLEARVPEAPEEIAELPAFAIDRTELTNAAFAVYAEMEALTGVAMPAYPDEPWSQRAGEPRWPATGLTWSEAAGYCAWLGKQLPTTRQWEKALRGGLALPGGEANPMPRRNLPWGEPRLPAPAKLADVGAPGPAAAGSFPGDASPLGVLDLAGNVQEWTASTPASKGKPLRGFRIVRGGDWGAVKSAEVVTATARENQRPTGIRYFNLGARCALMEGAGRPRERTPPSSP